MTYGYPSSLPHRTTGDVLSRAIGWSYLRRLDWWLLLAALAMSVVGALLVWSATEAKQVGFGNDPQTYLKRHLMNLGIGLVLAFFVSRFDYRLLRAYTPILYGLSILGLVFVLVAGSTVNGARAWILLPAGFSIQPSEFTKIAVILGMAMILSEKRDAEDRPRGIDVVLALMIAAVPMALILRQQDTGTVLVLATAVFAIIAVSGVSWRWLAGMLGTVLLAVLVAAQLGLIQTYQIERLSTFIDPNADPARAGFNTVQARIAIGSGGLFGKGLFHGPQTQGGFVPKNSTDFIYSVAGEELGLVGAGAIIVLLGVLIWRSIRIALRSSDLFGRLVATGLATWLTFQAFENIGMNLGITPVTGVPLPFISYGGTSMFASWIAIGLLQNVHLKSQD